MSSLTTEMTDQLGRPRIVAYTMWFLAIAGLAASHFLVAVTETASLPSPQKSLDGLFLVFISASTFVSLFRGYLDSSTFVFASLFVCYLLVWAGIVLFLLVDRPTRRLYAIVLTATVIYLIGVAAWTGIFRAFSVGAYIYFMVLFLVITALWLKPQNRGDRSIDRI